MNVKPLLFPIARLAGFFELTRRFSKRYPIILVYHRFGPRNGNPHYCWVDIFERQVRLLKQNFNLLSLHQLFKFSAIGHPVPDNSVVLTVDDGYEDFYAYALPVLRKYSVPATVFVATDFIAGEVWLWPDQIAAMVSDTRLEAVDLTLSNGLVRFNLGINKTRSWSKIADYALDLPDTDRQAFFLELSQRLEVKLPTQPPAMYRPMSWQQVQEAHEAGVEIGSHTCTHPRLTRVDSQQLSVELNKSKAEIENQLQAECNAFCYPFGRKVDTSTYVESAVARAGYRYATIGYFNLNVTDQVFALKRLGVGNNWPDFIKKVYGWEVLQTFLHNRPFDR